ncbi:unnamed protein product [Closterium sp. Naga37s-1]|nr:unnamed protein product [Closterium sp. Naga37s-1]
MMHNPSRGSQPPISTGEFSPPCLCFTCSSSRGSIRCSDVSARRSSSSSSAFTGRSEGASQPWASFVPASFPPFFTPPPLIHNPQGFRACSWTGISQHSGGGPSEAGTVLVPASFPFLTPHHHFSPFFILPPSNHTPHGFRAFPWAGINILGKDYLNLGPAAAQLMTSTAYMPWSVKPLYGGGRRIPYIIIANTPLITLPLPMPAPSVHPC